MKKLKVLIILTISCLFISACGCTKDTDIIVTFNSNGGTIVNSQTIIKGGKAYIPTDPEREGYTFEGWYINLDDKEAFDFTKEITKNTILIAKWSLNEDGGEGDKDDKVCELACEEGFELINPESPDCKCEKKEEEQNNDQPASAPQTPSTPTRPTTVEVTGVILDSTALTLNTGSSGKLTATVNPSNATNKGVTFTSSNTGVATVDNNGNIYAVQSGVTTIIVTTINGLTASATITVNDVYTYTTEQDGELNSLQHKVYVYKNGTLDTSIQSVYTSSGSFIGEYSSESGAIVVNTAQLSSIGGVKVNGTLYQMTKR